MKHPDRWPWLRRWRRALRRGPSVGDILGERAGIFLRFMDGPAKGKYTWVHLGVRRIHVPVMPRLKVRFHGDHAPVFGEGPSWRTAIYRVRPGPMEAWEETPELVRAENTAAVQQLADTLGRFT